MKPFSGVSSPQIGGSPTRQAPLAVPILRLGAVVVLGLALVGAMLATKLVTAGPADDPNRPAFEVGIAHPAPTTFGTIAVEFAQFLGGPTANALTGASHNVGALIPPDRMQIEATVTITNFAKHTVDYSPAQFELLIGKSATPLVATRASVGPGTLQPDAGIDERLVFEAPLSRADVTLRYRETPTSPPILMKLGHHTGLPQRAHDEKPGEIVGIGQTLHDHATGTTP